MQTKRNRLYALLILASISGFIWLYFNIKNDLTENKPIQGCLIKHITNIPCPSCGSTRSIISITKGNYIDALQLNPLGYFISFIMFLVPIWVIADIIMVKNSLYNFYCNIENSLKKPKIAIPLILLVIINWIWNINKGL